VRWRMPYASNRAHRERSSDLSCCSQRSTARCEDCKFSQSVNASTCSKQPRHCLRLTVLSLIGHACCIIIIIMPLVILLHAQVHVCIFIFKENVWTDDLVSEISRQMDVQIFCSGEATSESCAQSMVTTWCEYLEVSKRGKWLQGVASKFPNI
jgi:hypothetical protein